MPKATAINPLSDRVVAKREQVQAKTSSGIYLPEQAQEKPKVAEVVAVGPDVKSVKPGDRILYEDFSSTEVKVGDDEFIIVKEEKIIATVK